jgi:glycosyltransferase involved in cell wall biosynthesis
MNDQKKPIILHVIQTLGPGGAERLLVTYLSQQVLKDAFQHIVALTDIKDINDNYRGTFLVKALKQEGVEVIGIGSPGPRHLLRSILSLKQLMKSRHVNLVHSQLIWSNVAARIAARIANVPIITSFQNADYDPQVMASFKAPRWKQNLIKWLDGWTARNCDSISVAVSRYVAKHVEKRLRIDPARLEIICNSVDTSNIQPDNATPRLKMREELGLSPDAKMILSVGRVTDQKAFIELVDAFDMVCNELPADKLNLVIVGAMVDQRYCEQLNSKIAGLNSKNQIFLVGARSDIGNWLAAADVFAFPTKFEGLPVALVEAMSVGLPCVATNVGPIPELIEDEKTGLLVSSNKKDELAPALKRLIIEEPFAKSLGQAASRLIRSEFTATEKAQQFYELYSRVMKKEILSR